MIEDKKMGLKMAENEDEAMWEEVRERTEAEIKALKKALKLNEAMLELAKSKKKKAIKK